MIKSFGNKAAEDLHNGKTASRHARLLPRQHVKRAVMLLEVMDASSNPNDFRLPPSNRLHQLGGDLDGFYSITIRDGWRIVFKFENGQYIDVQIMDYH